MSVMTETPPSVADEEAPSPGRRRKLVLALLVLVMAGAAAWFLVLAPDSGPAEPVPGEVATLDPIQVNLAGGHYLRVGIALQLTEDAHEIDGSMALDATIDLFSGLEMSAIIRPNQREELKDDLEEVLHDRYHGDVMGVYFTEFVTQ